MTGHERDVRARLSWDADVEAGYLEFVDIGPGEAVHQRVVPNPEAGLGDLVLDVDDAGHLLGIEIAGARQLPAALLDPLIELGS